MSEQTNDLIERKVREAQRYFYDDGLVEIGVGFIFLLIGLVLVGWLVFDVNPVLRVISIVTLPLVTTLGALLMKRAVTAIKERVTYPRTGYVSYRQGEPARGRWLVIAAVLILVVAMYFLPDLLDKMPVAVGAILAAVLAFLGYRVGLGRFYISAIATLLTGLGAAVYVADELLGAALAFVVAGLVLMVGGGLAFLSYLRDHPLREEETAP